MNGTDMNQMHPTTPRPVRRLVPEGYFRPAIGAVVGLWLLATLPSPAAPQTLYQTEFEAVDFDPAYSLDEQDGWIVSGTGGSGIYVDGLFGGASAFVGGYPPTNTNTETTVWRPLDRDVVAEGHPVVLFEVNFAIWDSTTNAPFADEFRWSVINRSGRPLCQLVFDNFDFHVSQVSGGAVAPVDTLQTFQTNTAHTLRLRLDLANNQWSALLSNQATRVVSVLATNLPLAPAGTALDLGDVDGSWVINDYLNPGDNFMEFDGYRVTVEGVGLFQIGAVHLEPDGTPVVEVAGEEGADLLVESSAAIGDAAATWQVVGRGTVHAGGFVLADPASRGATARFYRARVAAP
jgi:hypothetical protein